MDTFKLFQKLELFYPMWPEVYDVKVANLSSFLILPVLNFASTPNLNFEPAATKRKYPEAEMNFKKMKTNRFIEH